MRLVSPIVTLIEATDDEAVISRASGLVRQGQVVASRLELVTDTKMSLTADNLDTFFADAVELYALAVSMFPYARFESDSVEDPMPDLLVGNAVNSLGLHGPRFAGLYERLRWREHGSAKRE